MKKVIIYIISIIIIFLISVYIGFKFKIPDKIEENIIGSTSTEKMHAGNEIEQNEEGDELEQAVSEEKANKEHYILREVNKYVKVYILDDSDKEELYLSTDISTEYLPETDKKSLKKGIHVYNKSELNEILQDFE